MGANKEPSSCGALTPVGIIHSCFTQKFGIPRQPRLASAATAVLELYPPWNRAESVRELETFSHLWLVFLFHQHMDKEVRLTVRPPRLGGNKRIGVFASRSSFRPNPIGMSAVQLEKVDYQRGVRLHLRGIDLLDGTPVLDIKPYLPYSDCINDAVSPLMPDAPELVAEVCFSDMASEQCVKLQDQHPEMRLLIVQLLQQDPRPAYHDQPQRRYRMQLWQWDVCFYGNRQLLAVESIKAVVK